MGGMKTNVSDPDVAAMAISQSVILHKTIESAGAVKDLVYHCMIQDRPVLRAINMMFTDAIDTLPYATDRVDEGFATALRAAGSPPDHVAGAIKKIIQDEVEKDMIHLPYWGDGQAVADGFAAAFPDEANTLIKRHSARSGGSSQARLDRLSMLSRTFHAAVPSMPIGRRLERQTMAAFDSAAHSAASRAADEAWGSASPAFALSAAALAVMLSSLPDEPRDFLRHTAPGVCRNLFKAILSAGGPRDLALAIPTAILEGAREYPDDGSEASGEAAVRGLRAAHMWASDCAAVTAFQTLFGMAAGAAWATGKDRARFESTYDQALEAAGVMDQATHYAFDDLTVYSWEKMPYNDAKDDTWKFFYDASGRTVTEWAEIARGINYQSFALSPENAALIGVYGAARDGTSEAAARIALKIRESSR